jgi:hypothetical protein
MRFGTIMAQNRGFFGKEARLLGKAGLLFK